MDLDRHPTYIIWKMMETFLRKHPREYVGDMWKYVGICRTMWEYVEHMWEYVGICREYVGICGNKSECVENM